MRVYRSVHAREHARARAIFHLETFQQPRGDLIAYHSASLSLSLSLSRCTRLARKCVYRHTRANSRGDLSARAETEADGVSRLTESGKRGTGRGKGGELSRAFANRLPSIRRFVWTGRLPFNARASRREEMTATTMTTASTTREFRRASRRNWCSDGEEAKRTEAEERARKSGGRVANVRVLCAYACVRVCVWSVWLENACRTVCVGVACAYHLRSHSSAIYFFGRSKISEHERGEGTHARDAITSSLSLPLTPLSLSLSLVSFFPSRAEHRPRSCAPGKTRGKFTTGGMNISGI